jgi:hypothetical protein
MKKLLGVVLFTILGLSLITPLEDHPGYIKGTGGYTINEDHPGY